MRVFYATGRRDDGFTVVGFLNSSNFIAKSENQEKDKITVTLGSFDSDTVELTDVKGVPEYFKLLPCEFLAIGISMQKYKFIDRPASPCQNEYPPELKSLLLFPVKPENLYNSILAPELPYSVRTVFPSIIFFYF